MLVTDFNSTHVFYIGGIQDRTLDRIEEAITQQVGTVVCSSDVHYSIVKGYGFNNGSIQIEGKYEDMKTFVTVVEIVTKAINENTDDDYV